jgi:hypothetical protein
MSQTFTLELGDKGGSHKFTSARALRTWVDEENNKWAWVLNFPFAHIAETQRNPLTRQQITDCLQQAEAAEASNNDNYTTQMNAVIVYLRDLFLSDQLPIYSGSQEGQFVLDNKERFGSNFASQVLGYVSSDPGCDKNLKLQSDYNFPVNMPL